jgi:DNA-binding response OmpR family regulator
MMMLVHNGDNVVPIGHPALILVVDDDPLNRELMEALLTMEGYTPLLAQNAERGWELALAHQPDLVLVDVRLQRETEGYELCRRLKTSPETAALKVAMLTGLGSETDRQLALEAGADDFISRTGDTTLLLAHIVRLLGQG